MGDEKNAFQPGDIVELRTGGHRMVVHSADHELVTCLWFDGSGRECRMPFPTSELAHVVESAGHAKVRDRD